MWGGVCMSVFCCLVDCVDLVVIGVIVIVCFKCEVVFYFKFGFVSLIDSGVYDDMDVVMMDCSVDVFEFFFVCLVDVGVVGVEMDCLCVIGIEVEVVMMVVIGGVNMYCGVIFGMGLFCVVVGFCVVYVVFGMFGDIVVNCWGLVIGGGLVLFYSYGSVVVWWYGVGGVWVEVVVGFFLFYVVVLFVFVEGC